MNLFKCAALIWIAGYAVAISQETCFEAEVPKGRQEQPNIIYIFTDDHSTQTIGAYKDRFASFNPTPQIDRIAKNGILFKRCYVANSICGPSRASILTGKYPHLHGFYKNDMIFNGKQQTFPKLLQQAGYETALIGKWHLTSEPTGFDHYEVLTCWGGQGKYVNPEFSVNGETTHIKGYTSDIISDHGMDWLKNKRSGDKPFLLMLQHKAPHRPWLPSPKFSRQFADVVFPEPETLFDDYASRGTAAHAQDMTIGNSLSKVDLKLEPIPYLEGEDLATWHKMYDAENESFMAANLQGRDLLRWKYQRYIREYLRCISSVDESVGRVLDYLKESGLDKNTVVVYSSDQGFFMGEHGWFDKRFMYEESLRTPLLIQWPGVIKSGSVDETTMLSNIDFAATFLEIAGAPIPDDMQGRSFVPVLKRETPDDWRSSFYYHYYGYPDWHLVRRHCGVTDGRYKLIDFYTLNERELYDLKRDPQEIQNVIDLPEYRHIVEKMESLLIEERKRLEVPEDAIVEERFKELETESTYMKYIRGN